MTILPNERVHIEIATESTSPITGALTVAGGVGVLGNLNVQGSQEVVGNVSIQGSITVAGGQFVTENLSSTDPILFVGNLNEGNSFDLGFLTEAKQPTASARYLFDKFQVSASTATLTTVTRSISVKEINNNIGIITIGSPHSFLPGDTILISGMDLLFNGLKTITATTATQLKFNLVASDLPPTAVSGASAQYQLYPVGPRGAVVATDFITVSGAGTIGGYNIDGPHHISATTGTTISWGVNVANISTTSINPPAVGTRDSRSKYSGIVKDNITGMWHLFSNLEERPQTTVDFTLGELYYDDLKAGEITAKRGFNITNNITTRDTEYTPIHGTMVYRKDKNIQEVYLGNKWEAIEPIHNFLLMGV